MAQAIRPRVAAQQTRGAPDCLGVDIPHQQRRLLIVGALEPDGDEVVLERVPSHLDACTRSTFSGGETPGHGRATAFCGTWGVLQASTEELLARPLAWLHGRVVLGA